jgi:hypothetical protein
MAKLSLRRYDHQAVASIILSGLSIVTMFGLVFLLFRNLNPQEKMIYYAQTYKLAFLGGTAVTLMLSVAAFGLGLNSVGQRRNDKQRMSWIGFFIGAAVFSLTLVIFFIFHKRGEMIIQ